MICNSVMNFYLPELSPTAQSWHRMGKRNLFRELVSEGARLFPSLWKASGEINISAMARLYKAKGFPVSQPTLQRLWDGELAHQKAERLKNLMDESPNIIPLRRR